MIKMPTEIGSEFWNIPLSAKENSFFDVANVAWFTSGRFALKNILKKIQQKKNVKSAALPAWCCDSMIKPFVDQNIEVHFYPVYFENGNLIQETDNCPNSDILFLIDYFGYEACTKKHDFNGVVIRDITHSIFSSSYNDADFYFASLRKWAGFITGGFALGIENESSAPDTFYAELRKQAMQAKALYISGGGDKDFLKTFSKAEELLDTTESSGSLSEDIYAARFLDVDFIKAKRRKNAAMLLDEFRDLAMFPELNKKDVPLFVPILLEEKKRNNLRQYLIEKQIYCPIHWPLSNYHNIDAKSNTIYNQELSLVCDQRYDENDMDRMIAVIKNFLRGM